MTRLIADTTTAGPRAITRPRRPYNFNQASDSFGVGDGGAAEFLNDHLETGSTGSVRLLENSTMIRTDHGRRR